MKRTGLASVDMVWPTKGTPWAHTVRQGHRKRTPRSALPALNQEASRYVCRDTVGDPMGGLNDSMFPLGTRERCTQRVPYIATTIYRREPKQVWLRPPYEPMVAYHSPGPKSTREPWLEIQTGYWESPVACIPLPHSRLTSTQDFLPT